jgi:hypothetical protein
MTKRATAITASTATATAVTGANETAVPHKSLSDIGRQPVWKVSEAALLLRCNESTIRRALNRGTITGVRISNEWRIPAYQFSPLARAARSSENDLFTASGAEGFLEDNHVRLLLTQSAPGTSPPGASATDTGTDTGTDTIGAQHTLRIYLLGRPQIYVDDIRIAELERSNRRSQVIQLLALHRAGLSGMQLARSLNMAAHRYEDEGLDPHYVRTLVWGARDQVRKRTAWSGVIQSPMKCGVGLHHYRLADNTVCDLWEFEDKLDEADRIMAQAAVAPMVSVRPAFGESRCEAENGNTERAAALREEALQMYKGDLCEGSNNGCIAQAARMLEERYMRSALQQGDYWRAKALSVSAIGPERQGQDTSGAHSSLLYSGVVPTSPTSPGSLTLTHPEVHSFWREALRNYERVLKVDDYHEEAYTRVMECCAHLGNGRGVDQIFTRCQDVLHAGLMQSPGEDVVRTYQQCKAQLSVGKLVDQTVQQPHQYSGQGSVEFK